MPSGRSRSELSVVLTSAWQIQFLINIWNRFSVEWSWDAMLLSSIPVDLFEWDSYKLYVRKICLIDIALRNPAYDHRTCTYYLHAYACHLRCTTTWATCGLFEGMAPHLHPYSCFLQSCLSFLNWSIALSLIASMACFPSSRSSLSSDYLDHDRMRRNYDYEQTPWPWYHCE